MPLSSWSSSLSGDWYTVTDWTGGVPNSPTADVSIDALATATYAVMIKTGEAAQVNSITLNGSNNAAGTNQPVYKAAILEVDGLLDFAPGSTGAIKGPLQSVILLNNGNIINAGTINGFVQGNGISTFTGTNGIYFTNWLQSTGVTTLDTSSIAEYDNKTNTLFDGIFQATGTGAVINFGGAGGKNIVNITTIAGPKTVLTPDYWTQVILDKPTSAINEWNGTRYVPIESTLTTIGESGIVEVTGGRNYLTPHNITVQKDGTFEQTSGILSPLGMIINAGGVFTNGVSSRGPGTLNAVPPQGTLLDTGNILNNGTVALFSSSAVGFTGAIVGTGSITMASGSVAEVLGPVAAEQHLVMAGSDMFVIASPSSFHATVGIGGTGNSLVLDGVNADAVSLQNGVIDLTRAGTVVASVKTDGSVGTNLTLAESGGNAKIGLGTPITAASLALPSTPSFLPGGYASVPPVALSLTAAMASSSAPPPQAPLASNYTVDPAPVASVSYHPGSYDFVPPLTHS